MSARTPLRQGRRRTRLAFPLRRLRDEEGHLADRREMVTYSIVTLVFLIFITALCTGVDLLAGEGIEFMFGL